MGALDQLILCQVAWATESGRDLHPLHVEASGGDRRTAPARNAEPAADDWYANLLWFDGRKCLLITHAASLFSVFVPNVAKASLAAIGPLLVQLIERELAAENLPNTTFGSLAAQTYGVGYFMIRKVAAPKAIIASTGRVIADLLDWLVQQRLLKAADVVEAKERAQAAGSDLPKAEKLAGLLYDLAEHSDVDGHALVDEDYIEDCLTISRVAPGELWFEGDAGEFGPLQIGQEISRLAQPGWSINIVMGRVRGRWQVVEVGNVYPD